MGDGVDRSVAVAVGVVPAAGDVEVRTAGSAAASAPHSSVRFEARIAEPDATVGT